MKSCLSIAFLAVFSLSSLNLIKAKHIAGETNPVTFIINKGKCKCPQPDGTKGCCNDDIKYLTLDQDYMPTSESVSVDLLAPIRYIVCEILFEVNDEDHSLGYLTYKPPTPDRDIPVLIQSFLI